MTQFMDPAGLKTDQLIYGISATDCGADQIEWYDLHLHSWHIAKTGVSDTDTYIIWYI